MIDGDIHPPFAAPYEFHDADETARVTVAFAVATGVATIELRFLVGERSAQRPPAEWAELRVELPEQPDSPRGR